MCHVCSAAGHEGTTGANGSDWEIGASGQSLISCFILCVFHHFCERFALFLLICVKAASQSSDVASSQTSPPQF